MNKLLFIITAFITTNCFSQIRYDKGYFIDNFGKKTDCFIKNLDWKYTPASFEYKLELNGEVETAMLKYVQKFGVVDGHTYERKTVYIDRSEKDLDKIDFNPDPVYTTETLFLRLLVDGKADLYSYKDKSLDRYFYSLNESPIEQLVYKLYKTASYKVSKNSKYKTQLWENLGCEKLKSDVARNTKYLTKDLVEYFLNYNLICHNIKGSNLAVKPKNRDFLNLTIRLGIVRNSLRAVNFNTQRSIEFDLQTNYRFGLELEYVLPFNKNKWSVFIEPTFQSYSDMQEDYVWGIDNIGRKFTTNAEAKYKSVELPIGIRHHMFLSDKSKIFIDIAYIQDFSMKSLIDFELETVDDLEIISSSNIGAGIGYNYNNKYSIQLRYHFPRTFLKDVFWTSDYKSASVVFGYNLL